MSHYARISAVFLKDLRQLWLLGALTALLLLAQGILVPNHSVGGSSGTIAFDFLSFPAAVVPGLFLVWLVQRDSAASVRSEWLARPIGGIDLFVAKFLLAALVILLPEILGTVIGCVVDGMKMSEALLFAIAGTQNFWIYGLAILLATAVAETVVQAACIALFCFLGFVFTQPLRGHVPGDSTGLAVGLGSFWVLGVAITTIAVVGGFILLWLVYARRRLFAARCTGAAIIVLLGAAMALPRNVVLAAQRAVASNHPVSARFSVDVTPECIEANYPTPLSQYIPHPNTQSGRFVAFSAIAHARGLPAGWRMMVTDIQGGFMDGRGAALDRLDPAAILSNWSATADGAYAARHAWVVSRERYDDMFRRATDLRLRYGVQLLEPMLSAEIAADGKRHHIPGLGTCTVGRGWGNSTSFSCLKTGRQANVLTFRPASGTAGEVSSSDPDFAPGIFQFSPGNTRGTSLQPAETSGSTRVTVTAYQTRAYVERTVSLAGLLHGRVAVCRPDQLR